MSDVRQAFAGLPIAQIVEIQMYYPEYLAQKKVRAAAGCSVLCFTLPLCLPPPSPVKPFQRPRPTPGAHAPSLGSTFF